MNPKLSVIIPIFKVEDYLERCVLSVINQDYRNIEIILVDDGSPDRCPQICDTLALTDDRIVVIHKPNGGLSSARNTGIDAARGEYLAFLDSDDQWAKGKLGIIMELLEETEADMLIYNSVNLYSDGTLRRASCPPYMKRGVSTYQIEVLYPLLIENGNLQEQAGTHIIRHDYLTSNGLYFKEGLLGEDTEWMMRALRRIKSVAVTDTPLQIYTAGRIGAITSSITTKNIQDLIDIIRKSIYYHSSNLQIRKYELAHCSYLWATALGLFSFVADADKHHIKQQLKMLKSKLNLQDHPKAKMPGIIYAVFGFNFTAWILALYIKAHRKNLVNKKEIVHDC